MRPIFEYANYRAFLRDFYHEKKLCNPYYSYRLFSMKAGFRAPNLLKLVMDGDRNLTRQSLGKFVKALKLGQDEAQYFESLVACNQEVLRMGRYEHDDDGGEAMIGASSAVMGAGALVAAK